MRTSRLFDVLTARAIDRRLLVACLIVFACVFAHRVPVGMAVRAQNAGRESIQRIRAEDIGGKVRIVGRLGRDLGAVLKVRGEWKDLEMEKVEPKTASKPGDETTFFITHINGERLDAPVRFTSRDLPERDCLHQRAQPPNQHGDVWELTVVELGGWLGEPAGLAGIKYPRAIPSNPRGTGFSTYLNVLDYSDPKPKAKNPRRS